MHKLALWLLVLCCLLPPPSWAKEPPEKLRVVLFTVPETVWQAEFEGNPVHGPALWTLLDQMSRRKGGADRPLDVECALHEQEPFEWKRGQDQKFATSWVSDPGKVEAVPKDSTQRFVGTWLALSSEGLVHGDRLSVLLKLEHHTRPPVMQKHNYANAAEGKERERLSAEYPEFTKLVWEGGVRVGHEWRLLARMLQPADEKNRAAVAQRHLLFITRVRP